MTLSNKNNVTPQFATVALCSVTSFFHAQAPEQVELTSAPAFFSENISVNAGCCSSKDALKTVQVSNLPTSLPTTQSLNVDQKVLQSSTLCQVKVDNVTVLVGLKAGTINYAVKKDGVIVKGANKTWTQVNDPTTAYEVLKTITEKLNRQQKTDLQQKKLEFPRKQEDETIKYFNQVFTTPTGKSSATSATKPSTPNGEVEEELVVDVDSASDATGSEGTDNAGSDVTVEPQPERFQDVQNGDEVKATEETAQVLPPTETETKDAEPKLEEEKPMTDEEWWAANAAYLGAGTIATSLVATLALYNLLPEDEPVVQPKSRSKSGSKKRRSRSNSLSKSAK